MVKTDENSESGLKFLSETNQDVNKEFDLNEICKSFKEEVFFSKQDQNSAITKKNSIFENQPDEYLLIKSTSFEACKFESQKTRANSILKTLEAGCRNIRIDDE